MRALNVLAGLALAASLVACSDDGGGEPDAQEPTSTAASSSTATPSASGTPTTADTETPEAALELAYRTYIDAFLKGDGATPYGLLTKRCKDLLPLSDFAASAEAAAELYGPVKYEISAVTVTGDEGRVRAEFPVEALQGEDPRGSLWRLEGGEWRSDKCD